MLTERQTHSSQYTLPYRGRSNQADVRGGCFLGAGVRVGGQMSDHGGRRWSSSTADASSQLPGPQTKHGQRTYYGGVLDLARVISCAEPAWTGGAWGGRDINGWAAVLAGGLEATARTARVLSDKVVRPSVCPRICGQFVSCL